MPRFYPRWLDHERHVNLREVAPGLYVGASTSPATKRFDVVYVLSPSPVASDYRGHGQVHFRHFRDGESFPPGVLDEIAWFYRSLGPDQEMLVHCAAGLSRSASAAYAVLRAELGFSEGDALRRVKAHPSFPMVRTLDSAEAWARRQGA